MDLLRLFFEDYRLRVGLDEVARHYTDPPRLLDELAAHFTRITGDSFPAVVRRMKNDPDGPRDPEETPYVYSLGEIFDLDPGKQYEFGKLVGFLWIFSWHRFLRHTRWGKRSTYVLLLATRLLYERAGFSAEQHDSFDCCFEEPANWHIEEDINLLLRPSTPPKTPVDPEEYREAEAYERYHKYWHDEKVNEWPGRSLLHRLEDRAPSAQSRGQAFRHWLLHQMKKPTAQTLRIAISQLSNLRNPLVQQIKTWAELVVDFEEHRDGSQRHTVNTFDVMYSPPYREDVADDDDEMYEENGWMDQHFITQAYNLHWSAHEGDRLAQAMEGVFQQLGQYGNGSQGFVWNATLRPNHPDGPMGGSRPAFPAKLYEVMQKGQELEEAAIAYLNNTIPYRRRNAESCYLGNCLLPT